MLLLNAEKISKGFGDRKLFEDFSIKIYSGDRIGLIGPNGAGKTTLLNILAGLDKPDDGRITLYTSISYIRQQDDGIPELASSPPCIDLNQRLTGFLKVDTTALHHKMSGGEKARARFVFSYDSSSGLIIADEPTSNMDIEACQIIEKELSSQNGALLIVSHDRSLLDKLCTSVIEISAGIVRQYSGNYSDYVRQRDEAHKREVHEYKAYLDERERLNSRIEERVENMKSVRKAPKRMGNSEARLHTRKSTSIQKKLNQSIEQLESRLQKLEVKERPQEQPFVKMCIEPPQNPVSLKPVRAENLTIGFNKNLLISNASFEVLSKKRTALLGKNGTGKTTLAEMIAAKDERLTIAPGVHVGYFKQDFSLLDENRSILDNVMEESSKPQHEVRGILARLLITGDAVFKKVSVLSGGEKVKVSIAKILVSKANFIILDEPTNYLDVFSMEALESVLSDYTGTLLLISHDRKFIENIAERLIIIENRQLKVFEGTLREYDESLKKSMMKEKNNNVLNTSIIQMRLAELSAKIGGCKNEQLKSELEAQYMQLARQIH